MEMESQTTTGTTSPSPDVASPENHSSSNTHRNHRLGTVIPNRIFVGGINFKVNEDDLRHIFSQYGAVKEVKIVVDRSGMSKGYAFVTFETPEDAQKILHDVDDICFKDKKLNIGQAVRKQQAVVHTKSVMTASSDPAMPQLMPYGTLYLTTPAGYPYTYHNGVAYFHNPDMNLPTQHWPSGSPVMVPHPHQPVYQQPAYHHYQTPMASSPVMYMQPSDYLYQPTNGSSVRPPASVLEGTIPGDQMCPTSMVHLKPKHHRCATSKDYNYLPKPTEPTDPSMVYAVQPPYRFSREQSLAHNHHHHLS